MKNLFVALGVLVVGMGCAPHDAQPETRDRPADLASIDRLTDRLAESISSLDAQGAAVDFPLDSSIAYISDGFVIRGVDYIGVLESYYARVDSLRFEWTEKEIWFPTPESAVFVGWASIRAKVGDSEWIDDPAIFTSLLSVDDAGDWKFVTTHKTSTSR